jgi:hypothetical protein
MRPRGSRQSRAWITPTPVTPPARLVCSATGSAVGLELARQPQPAGVSSALRGSDSPGRRCPSSSVRWGKRLGLSVGRHPDVGIAHIGTKRPRRAVRSAETSATGARRSSQPRWSCEAVRCESAANQPHVARNARGCDSLIAPPMSAPVSPKRQRRCARGPRRRRGCSPLATRRCLTVRSPSDASRPALCAPRLRRGGPTASPRAATA